MTTEPANPYAPSAALAEEATKEKKKRPPSRLLAVATTLLALPLAGTGLYIFGRERRCRAWIAAGLCLWTAMIVAARTQLPKLFVIGFAGAVLVWLASIVDTLIAKPGTWHTRGRAWLAATRFWGGLPVDHVKGTATLTGWLKAPKTGVRWSRIGRTLE